MPRAAFCLILAALCGCATGPSAPTGPEHEPQLIEPTEHLPAPDHADVPKDIKHLGAMVPRWTVAGDGRAGISPTHVYQLSSAQGELRALSTKNGSALWRTPVQPLVDSKPVWHQGHVLVATAFGLSAYSESNGERAWTWPGRIKDLLVTEEALFVLGQPKGSNGQLQELDGRTGDVRWARPCAATCELLHAQGLSVLVSPVQGRLLRIENGKITRTLSGLKDMRGGSLLGDDVLVVTSTAVTRTASGDGGWSIGLPRVRGARMVGPHLLVDRGDALLALAPKTGEVHSTITLSSDLQDTLRLELATHLPEGQMLVPTHDLFGAAPVYLLIRDDGTLRVLRYGLPGLVNLSVHGPQVLYEGRSHLVYSGTRRRGAPLRHYETLDQDVAQQLDTLATPPADLAQSRGHSRALQWLRRLGKPAFQQALHAKIAGAEPKNLDGLLSALEPTDSADAQVLTQAAWRLSLGPASLPAAHARNRALQALPEPWPTPFWRYVLTAAPRWLAELPSSGTPIHGPSPETRSQQPRHPGARAQAHALRTLDTLQLVADRALSQGDALELWSALAPAVHAQRSNLPCPWPASLLSGRHPAVPRCPLTVPPPGALLSDNAQLAIWRAAAAGHADDVWTMSRTGGRWGPARLSGVQSASVEAATVQTVPSVRAMDRDRDRDGLSDLLEARWGTHPRRDDTDRDGLPDARDPSPSCPTPAEDDGPQQVRSALAQTVAALQPRATVWIDGSAQCLSATLLSGPLLRPDSQSSFPAGSVLSVDVLDADATAKALRTARASGQLRGDPSAPSLVLRYGIVHGPLDGEGATVIFVQRGERWHAVAWVDRWQS